MKVNARIIFHTYFRYSSAHTVPQKTLTCLLTHKLLKSVKTLPSYSQTFLDLSQSVFSTFTKQCTHAFKAIWVHLQ